MRMMRFLSIFIAVVALGVAVTSRPPVEKRILFIGNSYTFGGHVPEQIRRIAATSRPAAKYQVQMHVRGGTTLAQHIKETGALDAINAQKWDVVVLQDASAMSFHQARRVATRQAATTLAEAAKAQGAEIVYFAHWAPRGQSDKERAVAQITQTYADLAARTGGRVALAGQLWQRSMAAGVSGLYADDKHHATLRGAYVAAVAVAHTLGDTDPATSTWHPDQITLAERDIITALIDLSAEGFAEAVSQHR